ncbi:hypothetical protein [Jiulongibacter sediminis]|uniref:hypothetical protein n=1 Tax=Jiulongibacter sediminis TaxID=1605367 RepID=UPI0026EC81C3|nr:hypothetical protein [Jiulongibacter sediminis]
MKKLFAFVFLSLFFVGTASAQYAGNRTEARKGKVYASNDFHRGTYGRSVRGAGMKINMMQREARERIANGIINGTINSYEAGRLLGIAEKIEIKENRMLRNGRLTGNEVRELEDDLIRLNRMIMRNKRDNDVAPVDNYGRHGRRF